MNKHRVAELILATLLLLIAQKAWLQQSQLSGLHLPEGRTRIHIPFKVVNNLIIISSPSGGDSLNFILDTGVKNTILFNSKGIDTLIDPTRYVMIRGIASDNEIPARIAYRVPLSFGQYSGCIPFILLPELDEIPFSSHFGIQIDGIIGYDFFSSYPVKIDYQQHRITIHRKPKKISRSYQSVPIQIYHEKPYTEIIYNEHDTCKVLIDLGASHSLLMEIDSGKIQLPGRSIETLIGTGLGGEIEGWIARVPSIRLDIFKLQNMPVHFTNAYSGIDEGSGFIKSGSLGSGFFKRFNILIDYPHEKLYLKKNSNYNRPFAMDLSGIQLLAKGPNFKIYYIHSLVKNSPAQRAGIQTNDIILSVNGKSALDWEINDLILLFESKPGKKIKLEVLRNQKKLKYEFRLEELI